MAGGRPCLHCLDDEAGRLEDGKLGQEEGLASTALTMKPDASKMGNWGRRKALRAGWMAGGRPCLHCLDDEAGRLEDGELGQEEGLEGRLDGRRKAVAPRP